MRRFRLSALLCLLVFFSLVSVALSQTKSGDVPRVVRHSGTLKNVDGSPRVGTIGVSFAIYADDKSTAPLWQELQNVVVDSDGHYTVLLGASRSEGLPDELFAANDARWLGVRVENEAEQPRALLAAVPYALKAADAETLGGKPLSAFVLNETSSASGAGTPGSGETSHGTGSLGRIQPLSINPSSTGTQNYLAMWTDSSGTLGNSNVAQSGTNVGIGTTTPNAPLQVGPDFTLFGAWPTMGYNLYYDAGWKFATAGSGSLIQQDYAHSGLRLAVAPAVPAGAGSQATLSEAMFVASTGNVGVGTTTPVAPLQVGPDLTMYGNWPSLGFNLYYNSGFKYATTNSGSLIQQDYVNNGLTFSVAPSGAAGAAATPTSTLFVGGSGKVGIGTTSPAEKLDVNGNIKASGTISASNLSTTGTTTFSGAPSGTGVGQGTFYINPASASAGQTLFGVAVGGVQKMLVDASGNLTAAGALSGTSLALPATSSATTGVITFGGLPLLHNYTPFCYAGGYNVFFGRQAGNFSMTGCANTGIGTYALLSNTSGLQNTALGEASLAGNSGGSSNSAVGYGALDGNTGGCCNTAVGDLALSANGNGNFNTAIGNGALSSSVGGTNNVAVGSNAMGSHTSGIGNTAIGTAALAYGNTLSDSTAVGANALKNSTVDGNTAVGSGALTSNTSGANNIALGYNAGTNQTTGSNNVYIGHSGVAAENNTIRIGDGTSQARVFITGIRGKGTTNNDAVAVLIDSAGQLGTVSSSREVKQDIADMGEASGRVMQLRPVTFRYKQAFGEGSKPIQFGLIAEEVAETFPELAATGANGKIETVKYHLIPVLLLNEVQRQEATIRRLSAEVEQLRSERESVADLRRQVEELRASIAQMQSGQK